MGPAVLLVNIGSPTRPTCATFGAMSTVSRAMRADGNYRGTLGYEPNSHGEWQEQPGAKEPPLALLGAADHWNHREDTDYYSQPGKLFRLMTKEEKTVLFSNTAADMAGVPREIQIRRIANFLKADEGYGNGVAAALGIPVTGIPRQVRGLNAGPASGRMW